jgi:hypothetical protein
MPCAWWAADWVCEPLVAGTGKGLWQRQAGACGRGGQGLLTGAGRGRWPGHARVPVDQGRVWGSLGRTGCRERGYGVAPKRCRAWGCWTAPIEDELYCSTTQGLARVAVAAAASVAALASKEAVFEKAADRY